MPPLKPPRLQVKTVAKTGASPDRAGTLQFYLAGGFVSPDHFPLLWEPRNPVRQLIMTINVA
jgi:hypothetical protein